MTGRLAERVALISGAARGQGAVEARLFVECHARLEGVGQPQELFGFREEAAQQAA